jgi:hypothetical protein
MRPVRLAARVGLLIPFLLTMSQGAINACGGEWHTHYRVSQDPSIGYTVPIQRVYQSPATTVFQPGPRGGYTFPIQHVYQFPAVLVFQPGPEIPFGGVTNSTYDQYAGPSFIPR